MTQKSLPTINLIGPLSFSIEDLIAQSEQSSLMEHYVFIDGGVNHRESILGDKTGELFSIGDGDSGTVENLTHKYPVDKDLSDFSLALAKLKELDKTYIEFNCFGLWGERFDHMLAQIGDIHFQFKEIPIFHFRYFDRELNARLSVCKGKQTFNHKGTISIFSLEKSKVEIGGHLKYTGDFDLLPLSSHGLSNVSTGDFEVSSPDTYLVTFLP